MDEVVIPHHLTPEGVPVLVLDGEVDLARAPSLLQSLEDLLAAGHSSVVIDMLGVTFLDSTALGVLVTVLGRCREAGGNLRLLLVEPRILKVLEITGLADAFSIIGDPEATAAGTAQEEP